jgi:membrane-bound lytic murein transglycosylase A
LAKRVFFQQPARIVRRAKCIYIWLSMKFGRLLIFLCLAQAVLPVQAAPPAASSKDLIPVTVDTVFGAPPFDQELWQRRREVARAVANSLAYLSTPRAVKAYERFHGRFSQELVRRSLVRFEDLLRRSRSLEDLRRGLRVEFNFYRPRGRDGRGTVRFPGYFQPTYQASRVRTKESRFPIYRRPADFARWPKPHPSRVALEGYSGMGTALSRLRGLELAYLRNRFEAFMVHVQGSALLEFKDGARMSVGFAGATDYPFRGFVKSCLERKPRWQTVEQFFRKNPEELNRCLAQNHRFIFFEKKSSPEPVGSLGVPVVARCSLATDKDYMPPGALAIAEAYIPKMQPRGEIKLVRSRVILLDQDSGGGIKGPGRADMYMGSGPQAGRLARAVYDDGALFYMVLKPEFAKVYKG